MWDHDPGNDYRCCEVGGDFRGDGSSARSGGVFELRKFHLTGDDEDGVEVGKELKELAKLGLDGVDVFDVELEGFKAGKLGFEGVETLNAPACGDDFLP